MTINTNIYKFIKILCLVYVLIFTNSCKVFKKPQKEVSVEKKLVFQSHFIDACTFYNIDNLLQASKLFKKCIDLLPNEASSYHYLSLISVKEKKYNEALNFAEKAYSLAPENKFYCSHYAFWLKQGGQISLAQAILEKNIFEHHPKDELLCYELDDLLRINNQTEKRIKLWKNFNEKSNNYNKKAILKLIELYTMQKNFVEVHQYYSILQKASPSNINFLYEDGLIYKQEKNFEKYNELLHKASKINSTDWTVNIELYEFYKSQKNEIYFQYLGNALQDNKTEFSKKTMFLNDFLKFSEKDTLNNPTLRKIASSLSFNHSTNSDALYMASNIFNKTNDFEKSLNLSNAVNFQFPNFYLAWILTVKNQIKLNQYKEAQASAEQALTFFPTNGQLYILQSQTSILNKNFTQAYESATQAQKFIIDDSLKSENLLYMAQSLLFLNKFEEALKTIEKAIDLKPEQSILYNWKGNIFSKLNQKEKAIENWKLAQQKGDNSNDLQNKILKGVCN